MFPPFNEPVTIQTATEVVDRYGNVVREWAAPGTVNVLGIVYPRTSSEDNDGRTAVIQGLTVLLPTGTPVAPADRVVARGGTYEVVGEPADWRSPWGWQPGIQVDVERVAG
jgi:hypothetical protein